MTQTLSRYKDYWLLLFIHKIPWMKSSAPKKIPSQHSHLITLWLVQLRCTSDLYMQKQHGNEIAQIIVRDSRLSNYCCCQVMARTQEIHRWLSASSWLQSHPWLASPPLPPVQCIIGMQVEFEWLFEILTSFCSKNKSSTVKRQV